MSSCPIEKENLRSIGDNLVGMLGNEIAANIATSVTGDDSVTGNIPRLPSTKITEDLVGNEVKSGLDKRVAHAPFKNIEGFIEGMQEIIFMQPLHILHEGTVYNDNYESSGGYFLYEKNGDNFKREVCSAIANKTIIDISSDEMHDYNYHYNILKQNINNYISLYDYQMYLGGIINERINFLEKIKNKINTYKQNIFTDNRKNSYLSSNLEFYKNIHFYIFILYYVIFILFLIFSNFIKDKLYENKYVMIYILIILIIPFILRYILLYIYNLYISYIESYYLKLDEISYKYLVEETDYQINNKKDKQQLDNFHALRN